MSRLELTFWVVFWAAAAVALLRWPGRTLGLVVGTCLWSLLGPWAGWVTFGAVVAAAVAWRVSGHGQGRGLFGRPRWAVWALSAAATVLAPGWWLLAGLAPLVVSTWWVMSSSTLPAPVERLVPRRARKVSVLAGETAGPSADSVEDLAAVLVAETEAFLGAGDDTAWGSDW